MECHCRLNACLSSAASEGEKEREYEREKIRERRGRRERESKMQGPFVMGDMRMSEKEGTMVQEWKDGGGKGGLVDCGERGEGRGVFRLVGYQEGVKYQAVVVLCQSTVGPPLTSHVFVLNVFGMSCERATRELM